MIDYTVTLATYEMAPATYGNVYFEVDTSGPGHAVYSSPEVPGAGEVSFTDRSEFHKEGFRLPPQYSNTSNWTAVFDQPGEYAVTYKVISQDGTVVAAAVQKVNVTTGQSPYQIEITDLEQAGAGNTSRCPSRFPRKLTRTKETNPLICRCPKPRETAILLSRFVTKRTTSLDTEQRGLRKAGLRAAGRVPFHKGLEH